MSDLTNPLFDDEKEFLERKKLEYERALVADVEHLKENSLQAGKIVAVGAGAVAGIWLLSKLFGGRKKSGGAGPDRKPAKPTKSAKPAAKGAVRPGTASPAGFDPEAEFYTDGLGNRHRSVRYHKSAAESAAVFREHEGTPGHTTGHQPEAADRYARYAAQPTPAYFGADRPDDDGGSGFGTDPVPAPARSFRDHPDHRDPDTIGAEVFANAYAAANVGNKLKASAPASTASAAPKASVGAASGPRPMAPGKPDTSPDTDPFAEVGGTYGSGGLGRAAAPARPAAGAARPLTKAAGSAISTFLQSETGRAMVSQAGAVALALATKQLSKWFKNPAAAPTGGTLAATTDANRAATAKNADLAAPPAPAPSATAARTPEPAASSDDPLTPSQPPA